MKERAIIVTIQFESMRRQSRPEDAAKELEELCSSAGLFVVTSLILKQKIPNAALFLGEGKVEEIA